MGVKVPPACCASAAAPAPDRLIELLQVRRMLEVGACPDVVARSCENIRGLQTAVSVHIERVQEFIRTKLDHG